MKTAISLALVAMATALGMSDANAVVTIHEFDGNAVDYCQAFTPGTANTIRNRVVGSENVGAPMNVACAFHAAWGEAGATMPIALNMYFSNNNTSGTITVTCTLLTGFQGDPNGILVSKTTQPIASGGATQQELSWSGADYPGGSTTLGSTLVGVNCHLPTGAVINDTYLSWNQDNGV